MLVPVVVAITTAVLQTIYPISSGLHVVAAVLNPLLSILTSNPVSSLGPPVRLLLRLANAALGRYAGLF